MSLGWEKDCFKGHMKKPTKYKIGDVYYGKFKLLFIYES